MADHNFSLSIMFSNSVDKSQAALNFHSFLKGSGPFQLNIMVFLFGPKRSVKLILGHKAVDTAHNQAPIMHFQFQAFSLIMTENGL